MSLTPDFSDRAVIVTGAGSGIGRATALAFAHAGARVLGVGRRSDALEETARQHPAVVPHAADLTAEGAPEALVDTALDRLGRLDVVVNNAGSWNAMPLSEASAEGVTAMLSINVVAPTLLARAALPHLRESKGSIINLASTYGHRPAAGFSIYGASKAAMEQLTRSWALELAPDRIRVNAVAPGVTRSEAMGAAGLPEQLVDQLWQQEADRNPLGRIGEADDLATWILRLADPDSTWVTGQVLTVDGGLELL